MISNHALYRDVLIIGAGASGLMCGIEAGIRQRSVVILEHMSKVGRKIRVSGGGYCNFTNLHITPQNYISNNPHFCKSALARFGCQGFIAMVNRHGIEYCEREEGQLFCKHSSQDIIDMLLRECRNTGVEIVAACHISHVARSNGGFEVTTDQGVFKCHSLVIATGGLSYPQIGATDFGHRVARQFGLQVTPVHPGLVPLIFTGQELSFFHALSGVSLNVEVSCHGQVFKGPILFTHHGFSGPAILQISSYWSICDSIHVNLFSDVDIRQLLMQNRSSRLDLPNWLAAYLPKSFCRSWCSLHIQIKPLCRYTDRELEEIAVKLRNWTVTPESTEGYDRAEVTLGGVNTNEISSKTMEARKIPGLYFVGEVIDVAGHLGGYNLQWAWASGYVAGQYV